MTGILLITKRIQDRPSGGREKLCKLNHDCLRDIFGDALSVLELDALPALDSRQILKALNGNIDGVSEGIIAEIVRIIEKNKISCVFLDGSNLGKIAAQLKNLAPSVIIVTFFHNVESRFFWGSFKASKTPRALAVLFANYLAERKSVRHSDVMIALTQHDSRLLQRVYGRAATHVSPIAIDERQMAPLESSAKNMGSRNRCYLLFVGGDFYANRLGISWFIQNVAQHIRTKTVVVGKGLEALKLRLETRETIEIVGTVGDLSDWYLNAHCVIAPIFDGSGMKTKVAEALMFGKKVIGTPDAFSGYENVIGQAGWISATAGEFIEEIDRIEKQDIPRFDIEVRALFEQNYSYAAARARLARILQPLVLNSRDALQVDTDENVSESAANRGE